MTFEFMTGATFFALINLIIFLGCLYLFVKGSVKMYKQYTSSSEGFKGVDIPTEFFFITMIGLVSFFFGSVSQPKNTIDPVQNRNLIQYQDNNQEVIIETPAPRTEKLEGFVPLK